MVGPKCSGMEHTAVPPGPGDPTILLAADGFSLKEVHASGSGLVLVVEASRKRVACPGCGRRSQRVHSRYRRQVKDLPWHGIARSWEMWSRRFVCANSRCRRRIFAERLPGVSVLPAAPTGWLRPWRLSAARLEPAWLRSWGLAPALTPYYG